MIPERTGDAFQRETMYDRNRMAGGGLDWSSKPDIYKEYSTSSRIELPQPVPSSEVSLDQALRLRKSIRRFSTEPLSMKQLSYLLWASTGIQRIEMGHEFRTAPSAGALYPIETYLGVNNVEDVPEGIYHYSIRSHLLEQLKRGKYGRQISTAALGQRMCRDAAVVFIWTAVFQRSKWKYGQRGYRYIYIDVGHIAQNLALSATSLGLGACHIGALFDEEVNSIIGIDGINESVIYLTAAGRI